MVEWNNMKRSALKLSSALSLAGVLLLSGCATVLDATREEPIQDNPTSRTTGSLIDDQLIEIKAQVNIGKASQQLRQSHIVVTSYNGVVLLTGQVASEADRALAEETVKQVSKVRSVENELQIAGPTSTIVRANDAWITAKIKTDMLMDKRIDSTKVKVVTENGVVYLMGLISRAQADLVVNVVKQSHGVQKIVKVFEYIN